LHSEGTYHVQQTNEKPQDSEGTYHVQQTNEKPQHIEGTYHVQQTNEKPQHSEHDVTAGEGRSDPNGALYPQHHQNDPFPAEFIRQRRQAKRSQGIPHHIDSGR
jgi:hypothetical protein